MKISKLTLDEAIKYCLEVSEQNEKSAEYRPRMDYYDELESREDCLKRASEYRQLAEWLMELKVYKKLEICGNCKHYVSGTTHFGECHVTSDIEPCVVSVNQTACDTFFDYKDFRNEVEKSQP